MARRTTKAPAEPPAPLPVPASPQFDSARLIADIRKGDAAAIAQAYLVVFNNELGRLVLAHHLLESGVGQIYGAAATDAQMRYGAGKTDGALELAQKAGFDPAAHAVSVMTGQLEGTTNDAAFNHPDPPAYIPGADEDVY
jgi:hypothetical protein